MADGYIEGLRGWTTVTATVMYVAKQPARAAMHTESNCPCARASPPEWTEPKNSRRLGTSANKNLLRIIAKNVCSTV